MRCFRHIFVMILAAGFYASADEGSAKKAREVVADFLARRAGIEVKAGKGNRRAATGGNGGTVCRAPCG
jgi:hypothetical protein